MSRLAGLIYNLSPLRTPTSYFLRTEDDSNTNFARRCLRPLSTGQNPGFPFNAPRHRMVPGKGPGNPSKTPPPLPQGRRFPSRPLCQKEQPSRPQHRPAGPRRSYFLEPPRSPIETQSCTTALPGFFPSSPSQSGPTPAPLGRSQRVNRKAKKLPAGLGISTGNNGHPTALHKLTRQTKEMGNHWLESETRLAGARSKSTSCGGFEPTGVSLRQTPAPSSPQGSLSREGVSEEESIDFSIGDGIGYERILGETASI